MSIQLIAIIIFIILIILMAIFYRNATLEKLAMLPGEEIIFEEHKRKVSQAGSPRTSLFYNCLVRITNRRIIIAQKTLFGKSYALRHVICYEAYSNETDLGKSLSKGYLNMNISKSQVKISKDSKGTVVRIDIPKSMLTRGQYIEFVTERAEDYEKIFM